MLPVRVGGAMNLRVVIQIGSRLPDCPVEAFRDVDVELAEHLVLRRVMARFSQGLTVNFNQTLQNADVGIEIGKGHQVKTVLPGPVKQIVAARGADPDSWVRPLHGFGKHGAIFVPKELAAKVDRSSRSGT